jgi:hypothetical protein
MPVHAHYITSIHINPLKRFDIIHEHALEPVTHHDFNNGAYSWDVTLALSYSPLAGPASHTGRPPCTRLYRSRSSQLLQRYTRLRLTYGSANAAIGYSIQGQEGILQLEWDWFSQGRE